MNDVVIDAQRISKLYRLGPGRRHNTLRDLLAEKVSSRVRSRKALSPDEVAPDNSTKRPAGGEQLWALRDVSFQVRHGEVVGLIGSNGAGKSTLLKILSRIVEPTSGHARIRGKLGSLLEVGTGFDPELTGRENVYLNGAILGMKRHEIRRRFDEIVEFSEVERFIDVPVKRYSSGMHMRLAFAVAAHLEPDILAVDEVLAVGDASFQRKCLGKMGNVAQTGRTVLFVSHNMLAMEDLCDRVIWLKNGRIVEDGPASTVVSRYLQESLPPRTERVWDEGQAQPATGEVRLRRACVRPVDGSSGDPITVRTPFVVEVEYRSLRPNLHLSPALALYNEQGTIVFVSEPPFDPEGRGRQDPAGLYRHSCRVPGDLLNDGTYQLGLYVDKDGRTILKQDEALTFNVRDAVETRHGRHGKWVGAVRPRLEWSTELVEVARL